MQWHRKVTWRKPATIFWSDPATGAPDIARSQSGLLAGYPVLLSGTVFFPGLGLASHMGDLFSDLGFRLWSDTEGFAKSLAVSVIRAFSQPVSPSWTLMGALP